MHRNTITGIALGLTVLGSGVMAISAQAKTATKAFSTQQLSSSSYRVAQSTTTVNTATLEKSVFDQINRYRASKGLKPLQLNESISKQARIHSQNMASNKVAFGHGGFDARIKSIPISYRAAAENVAYNKGHSDPATQAVQGWLKSSGHLANIEGKNYNLTGIGVATSRDGKVYFTQIFLGS